MSQGTVVAIVAVIVILAVAGVIAWSWQRRRLKERFGPEYDRTVQESRSRVAAEGDLLARERRHRRLEIRPLSAQARGRYAQEWRLVQEQFVDDPDQAVATAHRLVVEVMAERGYPTEDEEERQLEDLSVEHGRVIDHYRAARETNERRGRGDASTEDLREALVHYRSLFTDLLGDEDTSNRDDDASSRDGRTRPTRRGSQSEAKNT
jgi:hypothetical protein